MGKKSDMNTIVCRNIKNLRISNKITQEEFAQKIGIAQPTVSKIENGCYRPDPNMLEAISKFFHVSIASLFNEEVSPKDAVMLNRLTAYVDIVQTEQLKQSKALQSHMQMHEDEITTINTIASLLKEMISKYHAFIPKEK